MTINSVPPMVRDVSLEHWDPSPCVLGIGEECPRLSWRIESNDGFKQSSYEVKTSRDGVTSTKRYDTSNQVLTEWPSTPLQSRDKVTVQVRAFDAADKQWTLWSDPVTVEAGLLNPEDWTSRFIAPEKATNVGAMDCPAPLFSKEFELPGEPVAARLYMTAHGVFDAAVNGKTVVESVLDPGWTSYRHRLRYRTFDVTDALYEGSNDLTVLLGDGWWRGHLKWEKRRAFYGDRLALCAQLEVEFSDGSGLVINSDESWSVRNSALKTNSLYHGSTIDLRDCPPSASGLTIREKLLRVNENPACGVEIVDKATGELVAPDGPPIIPTGSLSAQKIWRSPSGKLLVDFGQNAVGWVRLAVREIPEGSRVTVHHAEVLEHGELGVRPLRSAKAVDEYVIDGKNEQTLEPEFTLHGFRYAQVDGVKDLHPKDICMVLAGTGMRRIGGFSCSDERLNRLFENVVWGTRSNFVDIPTDCPQRDERLGWTGDIQVFSPTALYLFNVSGLLESWLKDLAAEQYPDGGVPHVIPEPDAGEIDPPACAWGDAAVIVPWNVYQATGDTEMLRRQINSMIAWVDCMDNLAGDSHLWRGGFQFGDWLDPTAPPDQPDAAKANPDVVATGCFARCTEIVSQALYVIGDNHRASHYSRLAASIRQAFRNAFVSPDGTIVSDAQTVYALAIKWGLLENDYLIKLAGKRLSDLVREDGWHIATGFVGTPIICDALTMTGHMQDAWKLLTQEECPSWLYPVTMGATTIWERWDSMLPDGSINPGEMTSFNHYALGAVAEWMIHHLAGLRSTAPGWQQVEVRPTYFADLQYAKTYHDSAYGRIMVSWHREGELVDMDVSIPEGVQAQVHLADGTCRKVEQGIHHWQTRIDGIIETGK
ncbi:alpha-L-rhamnosidase [Bifidobacterium sp. SO4]|uniref:alpha-L-rhamnosidase n=1 Tax=Bifidobacterium sp. SO4 TaxID=2809030 RepID=UPI001BDC6857|nr:alpha-L-rhamnosidase [Bifidobacterium sp. SO4]MBT1170618.1 family 78 glycoside hydrolase catalytic domain [Bifidobacterium sp. SO4]